MPHSVNVSTAAQVVPQLRAEEQYNSPRIVALGGGTGLAVLLRGLRQFCFLSTEVDARHNDRLTAIVTVADDGGSSGALRRAFRILAPGDVRNCLLALSDANPTLHALFSYRFSAQLDGHHLGNLMLAALTLMQQDFVVAVEQVSELLNVRGRVLPATTDDVNLVAEFADGTHVVGESRIAKARRRIHRVRLLPTGARALPQALHAIAEADLVVIGPGSLYTSLIPTLLVKDLTRAIRESHARVVLVMNLMTEPGETDGYSAADFILALRQHAPELPLHTVMLNKTHIPRQFALQYAARGSVPVTIEPQALEFLGCRPVLHDLIAQGPLIRHDPRKLAQALSDLNLAQVSAVQNLELPGRKTND